MGTNDLDRREFIRKTVFGGTSALLASASFTSSSFAASRAETKDKPIITRKLGKTGIEMPIVSFGVMRADNPALVQAAIKEGIIFYDTAHGYQGGKNEEMLGEVFKDHPRDSFVIATKVQPEETDRKTGQLTSASTSKAFLEKLDKSLIRLKMDYVDILYVHAIATRDAVLFPEMLDAVTEAKKSGKARHVGVSTHKNEPEVIQAAIDSGVYEVVLTSINYKQEHYAVLKETIAQAAKAGIGIVAMKTMAGGFHDKERKQPVNCKAALKFVLQDENVTTAIPGNTNFDHLAMNVSVNRDLTMTAQEEADLLVGKSQGGLYCQGCEHCVPHCPKGLPIPEIMRAYMYTYGYRDSRQAQELLMSLNIPTAPCADCAQCSATCAKNFAISERVTDVMRLTTVPEEFIS
ncbi:MAG: aldo/keto reductase [Ignavibacteriales bacterium]|nr:aldo/keto reductase [Ignavibacteriales bacterium]